MQLFRRSFAAVMLAVFCAVCLSSCGTGPESVAEDFVKAYYIDCDAKALMDLFNDDVLEAISEERGMDLEAMEDDLQESLDELKALYENYSIRYEITDEEDVDQDDIDSLNEELGEYTDVEVTEGILFEITVTMTDKDGEKTEYDLDLAVVKIDGGWYIIE